MKKLARYDNLITEVEKRKPKGIMEVGTWNGVHAAEMFAEAKKHNDQVIYYGFDLFEIRNDKINREEHNVKHIYNRNVVETYLKNERVTYSLFQGFSRDTIPEFTPDIPIDFLYIDGGHSVQTIFDDWNNCQRLIHEDTIVIFDDYYHHRSDTGCNEVIDSIDKTKYNVEFLDPVDFIDDQEIQFVKVTNNK